MSFEDIRGWIVYRSGDELVAVDPRGGSPRISLGSYGRVDPVAWAPDGAQLLLEASERPARFLLNDDGTLARARVGGGFFPDGTAFAPPRYGPLGPRAEVDETAWTPDGSRIAFVTSREEPGCSGLCDYHETLWIAQVDGNRRRIRRPLGRTDSRPGLEDQSGITWSPDGRYLAFRYDRSRGPSGARGLYILRSDGTGLLRLTENGLSVGEPAWSPDGSRIAFRCGRSLCAVNVDRSRVRRLTDKSVRADKPAWSPDGSKIAFLCGRLLCVVDDRGIDPHELYFGPTAAPEAELVWTPSP